MSAVEVRRSTLARPSVVSGRIDKGTRDLVDEIRDDRPPFDAHVGGQAADLTDFTQSIADTAPLAVGTVILASFVLLFLMTGSVVVPIKALLMIIVFSGFILARVLAVKETGVALVLAIFIDETLVRMLLVPATMSVLGEWNWWAPRWMKRLHARFGITE